jgi:hypothetical protein
MSTHHFHKNISFHDKKNKRIYKKYIFIIHFLLEIYNFIINQINYKVY